MVLSLLDKTMIEQEHSFTIQMFIDKLFTE